MIVFLYGQIFRKIERTAYRKRVVFDAVVRAHGDKSYGFGILGERSQGAECQRRHSTCQIFRSDRRLFARFAGLYVTAFDFSCCVFSQRVDKRACFMLEYNDRKHYIETPACHIPFRTHAVTVIDSIS